MKFKILGIFIISVFFWAGGIKPVMAMVHTQKNGLFNIDIPEEWHWVESPEEIIITYPDAKTVAIDIQLVHSKKLSQAAIDKAIKESNDNMLKGVQAHNGALIDNKEMKLDGVKAARLDFRTTLPNPIWVTYISFFNKGYAFTVTYGSEDDKIRSVMDDVVLTIKFK